MSCCLQRLTTGLAFISSCFLEIALPANAETFSSPDRWVFSGSAYLWGIKGARLEYFGDPRSIESNSSLALASVFQPR